MKSTSKTPHAHAHAYSSSQVSKKAFKSFSLQDPSLNSTPILLLDSSNETFSSKKLELFEVLKIGRKTSPKVNAESYNGIFDSKVLSRNHAEVMNETGKVKERLRMEYCSQ